MRDSEPPQDWGEYLGVLRKKWKEVPAGNVRLNTEDLVRLEDAKLLQVWRHARAEATSSREWYHTLYTPILRQREVLDVGSGFGIDGISFAENGARVTFLDIVESNLQVLRRLCELLGIRDVDFHYLEDAESLLSLGNFDVMWCQGSLICAPFGVARAEAQELLRHLRPGGRWIELAYPEARWKKDGKLSFDKWGKRTDGWAPWIEWYDLEKLLKRLSPAKFKTVLNFEFHNGDFVWFDLIREK